MAVHGCVKQVPHDSSDEDDGPVIFKRNGTPSKQSHQGSTIKKSIEKHDDLIGNSVSDQKVVNRQKSSTHINTASSCARMSTEKLDAVITKSVISIGKSEPSSIHENDLEAENSDDSDTPLSSRLIARSMLSQKIKSSSAEKSYKQAEQNGLNNDSRENILTESGGKSQFADDSDDEDDDKPLILRYSASNSLLSTKSLESSRASSSQLTKLQGIKKQNDDSGDEKPLISRVGSQTGGESDKKLSVSAKQPSSVNFKENRSKSNNSGSNLKSLKGSCKRSLDNNDKLVEASAKKAKGSGSSTKAEPTIKKETETDDNDHVPISQRIKKQVSSSSPSPSKLTSPKTKSASFNKGSKKIKKTTHSKISKSSNLPPGSGGGQKWTTLEHNGVIFPPPYKPHGVKMLYNGQPVDLTPEQEEVATMFAVMKDTDYASKEKFIENFMNDWRKILGKNHAIKKFELCDFTPIYEWHLAEKEKKKNLTTEEKKSIKEEKLKQEEKYMWAVVDGVKEKVGNFRVEPPGLFRGRGEHPKMGKLKKRIRPRDITINIGKGATIPECPVLGERWKEVKHDNTVTWLAFWNDPINAKEFKYVFLAASSTLKGQSDKEKYEKARKLKDYIHNIRVNYTKDFTSKDATQRQIAVATYLIDKLALRAGNEKDDDEAETVGCCTLKVGNVLLIPPNKIQFDFLGKDSIRYFNTVEVELPVYTAIEDFRSGKGDKKNGSKKSDGDGLFDLLDTSKLNAHLRELMPGLTAKVFRTYNASITLDEMLNRETKDGTALEKISVYQTANKEVAIICNHQRTVSKTHESQMTRLNEKIDELKEEEAELKADLSRARKGKPPIKNKEGTPKKNLSPEVLEKKLAKIEEKIEKLERDKRIKEDLKTVALGTSKINYLDPRISVAWCKRHEVPIEKIFNKSLLAKFSWAMDVDPDFRF